MGISGDGIENGWANEPIAIIGMSAKYAGEATNTENLWQMLANGRSAWTPFPASRFKSEGVYHPNNEKLNTTHVKGAHFLEEDVGLFDAAFFSYSAETAASVDPQYRLQLESVYEALESAGLPLPSIAGSNTSVFTGVFVHDYRDGLLRDPDNLPRLMATGTGVPMMSNRISHFFDLRGASMTIETACSSGMVVTHQAVQSLRTGESDMAIVGGANLTLYPDMFKALGSAGFLSGEGKSFAFDSRASGYGRGEGVATLVLKRLKDALVAKDPIRAVIRESMLNQDGKTETITTPSLEAQEALIRGCYSKAGLDPAETQYFEAHGTGTQAGDTIEARAIATVFSTHREPLLIGSIKTNLGHTEAASGLASIVKTALAMEKGLIPPSINFENPNPKITLEEWNLKLVRTLEKWPEAPIRRSSINNFGYGGTNAHIILEDAASWVPTSSSTNGCLNNGSNVHSNGCQNGHSNGYSAENTNGFLNGYETKELEGLSLNDSNSSSKVLLLSGKDEQACQRMVSNLSGFLTNNKPPASKENEFLESLAYTLGQRRTRFPWAAAHPVSITDGIDGIIQALQSPKFKPSRSSGRPRVGMVFTGQGAQWHAMGRELVNAYPVYKASLEEGERFLKEFGAEWSLMDELSRDADSSRINEVALSTPICVALQVSLVRLLRSWGIAPVAVTSHSSGEMAAAYAAGAMSYRKVMAYSYYRAVLAADKGFQGPVKGAMIAVGVGLESTEALLKRLTSEGQVVVACVNSPSSITVAGDLPAIKELEDLANAEGIFARRLKVDTAWHSHHMAPIAKVFLETLQNLPKEGDDNFKLDSVSFSSPVTGGRLTHSKQVSRPGHWVESLVQPVRFVEALTDMVLGGSGTSASNVDLIVEVGPHTALGGPIQQTLELPEFQGLKLPYYGTLVRKMDARDSMLALAANLVLEGCPVDMGAVNFPRGKQEHVKVLTDLPSYPWNHQMNHWVEPRFNRALCQRSQPPHELLGALVDGSNPAAPSWRHTLRISASPWTRDHVIQSNIVYPAAGYICLAIEAARQLVKMRQAVDETRITGYKLKQVDFLKALVIPDNPDGIEIQTSLRPTNTKDVGKRGWQEFEIWKVTLDNQWTQHAKGLIFVEFEIPSSGEGDMNNSGIKGYTRRVIPADLFSNLKALGIAHGPMFQNMKSIVQAGSEMRSVVTMSIPDTSTPKELPQNHVLHPVTLDSVITAPYSAIPGAGAYEMAAKVPRAVEGFWVSSNIGSNKGDLLRADSKICRDDKQGMEADVSVYDGDSGRLVLEMKGFSYQSLGRNLSLSNRESWETEVYNTIKWSPDISIRSPAITASIKEQLSHVVESSESTLAKQLSQVCVYFIQRTLRELGSSQLDGMAPHLAQYYMWLKQTLDRAATGQLHSSNKEWLSVLGPESQHLIDQVSQTGVEGELINHVGTQLVSILKGQVSPAEILSQHRLLYRFRSETAKGKRIGAQLSGLLKHLVHKHPRAQILEIGASAGGMTQYVLEALGTSTTGGPQASLYHYTDSSVSAFEYARESMLQWSDLLSFKDLDIELDPASQGFTPGTYDIVITSHALSATASVSQALENVHSLIKPGGVLLLVEDLSHRTDIQFVNGLFPGWWSEEKPERDGFPLLNTAIWDRHLREAGFDGIELELPDCKEPENQTSVTLLSRVPLPLSRQLVADPEKIIIVTSHKCEAQPPSDWLKSLQDSICSVVPGGDGKAPLVHHLSSASATPACYIDKICIFLGEVDDTVLYDLDSESLEGIRAMGTASKGLLWVTRGGAVDCERPELSLGSGFVRTLRTEYPGRKLLTLDLDPKGDLWSQRGISAIVEVLQATFAGPDDDSISRKGQADFEFAERDGVILISRIFHDVERNRLLSPGTTSAVAEDTLPRERFHQAGRSLCLDTDLLAFGDDPHADASLGILPPGMVEVEPKAYGASLNARDGHIMGVECAGIVSRVGTDSAIQGYAPGDRVVCILRQSSFPSRAVVDWTSAIHIPPELDFREAASLPVAFLTAYYSLVEISKLQQAQSVLIHAAASDVGQAAVMIAQHLGAQVYATVSSDEGRELVMQQFDIPGDQIFSSQDESFSSGILASTRGKGVDVVLNSLAGPLMQESFNLVAPLGHFVEIGKQDLDSNSNLEMGSFSRSVSFSAVDIPTLLEYKGVDVHRCLSEVMDLIKSKALNVVSPIISTNLADIAEAARRLRAESQAGKVVLEVSLEETVPVLPRTTAVKLSPKASYLIVGGNGGLGQSVAHWMVAHGAKNLVLLSRSASKSQKTAALAEELGDAGCIRVLPVSCDVASEEDLAQAIQTCAQEGLPPIRGLIHAAFVLQDSFVEKMTLEDWRYTTQSKIAGAWNLHNQFSLPGDLDFFILFSSINGILGYPSQAAYSAAGAYEDALAHWRVKHCGLPGVSIDLSVVNGVGYVAEAQAAELLRKSLIRAGRRVIDEAHVLSSLQSAIQSPYDPQFIVGGINSGPGPHWDVDGDLGHDMRVLPLKYRQPSTASGENQVQKAQDDSLAARIARCSLRDEAIAIVGSALADMLADMFMVPVEEVNLTESPSQQGIDSLVAVEVRNMLFGQAGAEVSIFNIMQSPSLTMLAADVVDASSHANFAA